MSEDQRFDADSLRKSIQQVGRLYPRLVNQDGKVLDGNHRAEADKDWEVKVIPTENRFKELLVRAHAHHRRRVPQEETRALVEEMAEALEKDGIPRTEIATKLVEALPYSERYTQSLIPDIYKNPLKVQAGQIGGEKSAAISEQLSYFSTPLTQKAATISERKQTVKIQDMVSCDRCHISTSTPVEWHNHQLCKQCHNKALDNPDTFNSYFISVSKKPEPHVVLTTDTPRSLDSWEYRKGQMSPQHSKRELEFVELCTREDDLRPVITARSFPLEETIPDAVFPKYNAVAYVDDPATHSGSRMDKDEVLREKFLKRNPGWHVFVFRDGKPEDWVQKLKLAVKIKVEVS